MLEDLILLYLLFLSFSLSAQVSTDGLRAYDPLDGPTNDLGSKAFYGNLLGGSFGEDRLGKSNAALV